MSDASEDLPSPTLDAFGGRIERLDSTECRIVYRTRPEWCNPRGTVQGGVFGVFLDDAMSYAALEALGGNGHFTTVSMSMDYVAAVATGQVTAVGKVIRVGRRIAFVEGTIECDGRTAVRGRAALLIL